MECNRKRNKVNPVLRKKESENVCVSTNGLQCVVCGAGVGVGGNSLKNLYWKPRLSNWRMAAKCKRTG